MDEKVSRSLTEELVDENEEQKPTFVKEGKSQKPGVRRFSTNKQQYNNRAIEQ